MSIALQRRVSDLETRVAAFVRNEDVSELLRQAEERIAKLEGEIRAMKARMGKKND